MQKFPLYHRTAEWLRLAGPLEPTRSKPCLGRASWSRVPRTMSGRLLRISKEETPAPLWATCARAQPPTCKVLPDVQREPPVSQFGPTATSPGTGHHKEPGSVLSAPSLQVFRDAANIPWSLLFPRLNRPSSLSLSSSERCSGLLLIFAALH